MIRLLILVISFLFPFFLLAQKVTISGRVSEANSGEVLINANIILVGEGKGTQTNQYGYFSLTFPVGSHELRCSYAGYKPFSLKRNFQEDTILNISVETFMLNEVVVKSDINSKEDKPVGFINIPIQQLKRIPMALGEMDLLKALAMTPGISTGGEGTAGLNVRGSNPDQNLVLLDEAPVYNTSHAFGYLSVFNPDAIKNIDVYKGGFPSRFGGRLASVLDITMKEGNSQKKAGDLSLGILSSRFLKEGPLGRQTSYLIAGRLMNTFFLQLPTHIKTLTGGEVDGVPSLWFYDLNAKINHRFKDNSQLFFSIYSNYDYYQNITQRNGNSDNVILNWGSQTASLRYNKIFSGKLFGKISLVYSNFKYRLAGETIKTQLNEKIKNAYGLSNSIRDIGLKTSIEYNYSPSFTQRIGLEYILHLIAPGQLEITKDNVKQDVSLNQNVKIPSQESALFLENEVSPLSFLKFNVGGRISNLSVNGASYTNFEPRLSAKISINQNHGLKLGYTQMQQYLHQLTSNGIGIPNDIWVTATEKVAPSKATQIDAGYYLTFGKDDNWELTLETYQKNFTQLIDYRQGSDVVSEFNVNWQDIIVKDVIGKAYGFEVMIQKKQGKLNGWLSYTNAISQRQSSEINKGEWYNARYDRRHNVAVVLNYQLTPKWAFTTNFVYQTGYPVTLPEGAYMGTDGYVKLYYSGRNNARISDFHRLDIGATYNFKTKKRQRDASWNLGIYNVYNRKNPNYLEIDGLIRGTQLSIKQQSLLPILPYFSYQVKF